MKKILKSIKRYKLFSYRAGDGLYLYCRTMDGSTVGRKYNFKGEAEKGIQMYTSDYPKNATFAFGVEGGWNE